MPRKRSIVSGMGRGTAEGQRGREWDMGREKRDFRGWMCVKESRFA
jgi:hypothetical protein